MYPNTISKKLVSVPDDILEEEKLFKTMNVFANFCYAKDITDEEECEIFDESLLNCVPYALSFLTYLVPYVLSCPTCLVLYVPRVLCAPLIHVPRVTCSRAHVLCASRVPCPILPHASWFVSPFSHVLYCLVPCVLYDLLSPFVFLSLQASCSYFSVYLLLAILGEN